MTKHKLFARALYAVMALALVAGLTLVPVARVSAVTSATVANVPETTSTAAVYTIAFNISVELTAGSDNITITFPDDTYVPDSGITTAQVTVNTTNASAVSSSTINRTVTITVPETLQANAEVTVVIAAAAGVKNPSTASDTWRLTVTTSYEGAVTSGTYTTVAGEEGPVDLYDAADDYVSSNDTIQEAIGAASAGYTLKAHAGTYAENVVIDKDITLESKDGAATTIIDASAETAADVRGAVDITVSGVTLGGDGVGFTIIAPDATETYADQYGVELWTPGTTMSDVTVQGNTIKGSTNTGSDSPQVGIHFWRDEANGTFTNITIKDNTLTTTYTVDMIPAWAKSSAGITANPTNVDSVSGTFDGNSITGYSVGMDLACGADAAIIKNNVVTGCDFNGIYVSGTGDIDVHDNEVTGCGGNGLGIGGTQTDIDVYENSFHGNGNGVKVYDAVADGTAVTLNYNDIYDNTNTTLPEGSAAASIVYENYGVLNANTSYDLSAKYNYWGAIGGPGFDAEADTPSTALGNGDVVSTDVTYDPWLTETQSIAVTDGVAYHGSTYPLEAGWNTLSVPLALRGNADTLGEIVGLGDYITSDNFAGSYYYDPGASNPWVTLGLSSTYEFEPGKAVYIKMSADASFPVLYSGQTTLPSVSLPAGWNLIGSAFGIDRAGSDYGIAATSDDADGRKVVATALASLGSNASVVISPSAPGQVAAWATVATDGSTKMVVGEGYWVFMTNSATLAGFEVTPIYWIAL